MKDEERTFDSRIVSDAFESVAEAREAAEIFRECFPDDIHALLGRKSSVRHVLDVPQSRGGSVLLVKNQGHVVAFAFLYYGRHGNQAARARSMKHWPLFVLPCLKHPLAATKYATTRISQKLRDKFGKETGKSDSEWKEANLDVEGSLTVFMVGVSGAERGRGWGKTIMAEIVKFALKEQKKRLLLTVITDNKPAIGLYEGMGFRKVSHSSRTNSYGYILSLEDRETAESGGGSG